MERLEAYRAIQKASTVLAEGCKGRSGSAHGGGYELETGCGWRLKQGQGGFLASLACFSDKSLIPKVFSSSVNFLGRVEDTLSEDTFWPNEGIPILAFFCRVTL